MAAARATYIVVWKKLSQVYSGASLQTVLSTPLPKGCTEEDKMILQMSYLPDTGEVCVFKLTDEQLEQEKQRLQEKEEAKNKKKTADNEQE